LNSCVKFLSVTKSYGETSVFADLSVQFPVNKTTALVGESGSGKSTMLQLINGLIKPDSGNVEVLGDGINYGKLPELRRKMGYAVQGAGLFPHLTVRQNVTLVAGLSGWGQGDQEERFDYLLDLLDLAPDLSDRYPNSLSGGQQQRVSLCRAMMMNPPLMLLDEPFSALDAITRASIHDEFLKLEAAESRSIILVTHDLAEAVKLASHLIILKEGNVVADGGVDEVRGDLRDPYIAQLFESGLKHEVV